MQEAIGDFVEDGPMQSDFATTLSNTSNLLDGAFLRVPSSYAINEQPEIQTFFTDLEKVAPSLINEAAPEDIASLHRMGVACRLCGQFSLAERFYGRALAIAASVFGHDSPDAAIHRNFLAGLYFVGGRYDESVILINESLAVYEKIFGPAHIYTRLTQFGLALALHGLGDKEKSQIAYKQSALKIQSQMEAQSQDRWSTFTAKLASLAAMKYEQGQYADAVELFRHCVIHEANEAWPGSLVVARSVGGLAVLCRSQGLDSDAAEFFKMALVMKKELCGEAHPEYQSTWKQYQELLDWQKKRGQ